MIYLVAVILENYRGDLLYFNYAFDDPMVRAFIVLGTVVDSSLRGRFLLTIFEVKFSIGDAFCTKRLGLFVKGLPS